MHPLLSDLESAVRAAASYLLEVAASKEEARAWIKSDGSLVLSLDLACDKILVDKLIDCAPLMSEERTDTHKLIQGGATTCIVIDPIDGTSACRRFLRQHGGQVGFGPLVGVIEGGRVTAAVYYNVPTRTLFSAVRGKGARSISLPDPGMVAPRFEARKRLQRASPAKLSDAVALHFLGRGGEGPIIEYLKVEGLIDNAYRFGGFANDCTRLAQGLEDLQLQLSVKPWDFAATLFQHETGYDITMDPFGTVLHPASADERQSGPICGVAYDQWQVQMENPVVVAPPYIMPEFLSRIEAIKRQFGHRFYSKTDRLLP
jgi:fructose-1,6-bisphosphatase/inositol monophosphatase family enzyme